MGLLCESCVYSIAFKRNCKKFCGQIENEKRNCTWYKQKEDKIRWSD